MSIVLVGLNGDIERRRLRRDSVFLRSLQPMSIGLDMTRRLLGSTTLTVWLNGVQHRLITNFLMRDGSMWSGLDGYSAPPIWTTLISGKSHPPLRRGAYCRAALNAERHRLIDLGYINRLRVLVDQRVAFVSQLFGTSRGDFFRQEKHEEVIITQMEVIRRLSTNVQVVFLATQYAPI